MKPVRPSFESLPLRDGDPAFSAWGLYGIDDQLGSLNLLTAENTLQAVKSEVQTGQRVTLDPPIDVLFHPTSGRSNFKQTIFQRGAGRPVHDDIVKFNTQVGAQWDGLRHLSYLDGDRFYGGVTLDKISGDTWVKSGAIAGRGVLLDYYAYAQSKGIQYKLVGDGAIHAISLNELKACAEWEGVEIKQGDILFVRSGFWAGYKALSDDEKTAFGKLKPETWVGVETCRDMAKWLWDSGISAAAGDAPGWERIPNYNSPPEAGLSGYTLHEIMLGGWGMPIGEMFELEALSDLCREHKRYSFFVTSAPLHVRGGVGSPPNAIAIF
ncbi:hypothetical protein BKA56DRAFT_477729 [Ilyonectria sp. MPI-CAGE-AT-0026]|nr:hypothetical protein BKA56DRAFT_477729 [Ilyonectria sp. MPI-CAGE-AT-0026]